jgi:hypothetical protein
MKHGEEVMPKILDEDARRAKRAPPNTESALSRRRGMRYFAATSSPEATESSE